MVEMWRGIDARKTHTMARKYDLPIGAIPGHWVKDAKCDPATAEYFFSPIERDELIAVKICGQCPVMEQCLKWALAHGPEGTWGGMTEKERTALRREMLARNSIEP
jgi:WhiB family redox-sensing transcriptional regulator